MAKQGFRIWISPPHLSGKEMHFIEEAFEENWITTLGNNVSGFENDLESYLNHPAKQVLALNSGTVAIHLALILAGVEKDDYVICQSFTFAATANPIMYMGAKPVFVDSEEKTWNLSPEYTEKAILACIEKGRKPKAILAVDLYGMPADYDALSAVADKYKIPLIEDAAESLGSSYKGRMCGTFGQMAILSFAGNKIITTSGGGALVTSDEKEAERALFFATQAKDNRPHYEHSMIGYNYRISNILAGIGRGQMTVINERVEKRRSNHRYYQEAFKEIKGITVFSEPNDDYRSNHWLSCILIDPKQTGKDREAVRLHLANQGIESRPVWKPMHLQPVYQHFDFFGDGTSEQIFEQGLCLPSGSQLSDEDLKEITTTICDVL